VDLWSKGLWTYPAPHDHPPILQEDWIDGFLAVRTVWNVGGVWSLPLATAVLKWGTLLAVPAIAAWIFWPPKVSRVETAAKAAILGGAIGNLWDRFRYGAVRDFIDVYFGGVDGWHWPTFNVADVALVCGIVLLLLLSFIHGPANEQEAEA
jgi:lipoprotein signal peptidase